ncbi:hypothetical protein A0128_20385 [Leptospira tipperaryensis]|uniref:Uncharacterized protein n=1 Tax=Leptospira tipperaryensis TaxID=2564040 RepID=A0A1D7V3F6_9LEPT|nr:hypothetical protein [Leptospira tipperaryensis]AOP36377.1 hypothetical protein A0128_20385 [Leptospira tipperaryensis]
MEYLIPIVINVAISIPISSFLLYYFRLWVSTNFSKSIEAYKKELEEISDKKSLELKKIFQDYIHYSEKKQEVYFQLYYLFSQVIGNFYSLTGIYFHPDYDSLSKEELIDFLKDINLSNLDRSRINAKIVNEAIGKEEILKLIKDSEYREQFQDSYRLFIEFKNYAILNELYFTDEINGLIDKILPELSKLVTFSQNIAYKIYKTFPGGELQEEDAKKALSILRGELKKHIRIEIIGKSA